MIALSGACIWVGLFVVLFRPSPPPASVSVSAPAKLHYVSERMSSGPAGLWSPQLFSLPSAFGFSGLMDNFGNGLRPRLELPAAGSAFLDYDSTAPASASGSDSLASQIRSFFSARIRTRADSTASRASSPLSVQFLEGLSRDDFTSLDLPSGLTASRNGWQATLEIEAGSRGDVSHVFVMNENRLGRDRNRLLQAVRQWRINPASAGRRGLLVVSAAGAESGGAQ
ncbi:MAG: hypothetical protein AB7T27_04670 [Kiritimatiellia bacterium]